MNTCNPVPPHPGPHGDLLGKAERGAQPEQQRGEKEVGKKESKNENREESECVCTREGEV